jgi:hypothetical protein
VELLEDRLAPSIDTTTTIVSVKPTPSTFGDAVTFTATVTGVGGEVPPSGKVEFRDGVAFLGSQPLQNNNGIATAVFTTAPTQLTGGVHQIIAVYGGNLIYNSSTSPIFVQPVNPHATTTTLTAAPNPSIFGQSVKLSAIVTPTIGNTLPTGRMIFREGNTILGTGSLANFGGVATATISTGANQLGVGVHIIVAAYSGDQNYSASGSPAALQKVLQHLIAIGSGAGQPPVVHFLDATTGVEQFSFLAYSPGFTGGVRVAMGDVNGDGYPDIITGPGPGGKLPIKIIDGRKLHQVQPNGVIADSALLSSFFPFSPDFTGGVFVAAGDVNGDGKSDVVIGAGSGLPRVIVVDANKIRQVLPNGQIANSALLANFLAFSPNFQGGVSVAAGDFNGDGSADVIAGMASGGSRVRVFNGKRLKPTLPNGQLPPRALIADFVSFAPSYTAGVMLSACDINGDGAADIFVVGNCSGQGLAQLKVVFGTPSRR